MTKQGEVRDWHKDMKLSAELHAIGSPLELEEIAIYWMNQFATEKERADIAELDRDRNYMWYRRANEKLQAAEAREKKLREALEEVLRDATKWENPYEGYNDLQKLLDTLYPKEEEAK